MSTSTPSPSRRIGHPPMPPIVNDLGEVTANYPVGALTKGVNLENESTNGQQPDTLDFMLNQFRKDYIANASTEPNDLLREQQPEVKPVKSTGLLDRLTKLPPMLLVVMSLAAGGLVALFIVSLVLIALRLNL